MKKLFPNFTKKAATVKGLTVLKNIANVTRPMSTVANIANVKNAKICLNSTKTLQTKKNHFT
jgi:hypothetical protein